MQSRGFRACIDCNQTKGLDDFYAQGGVHKGTGRLFSRCKSCHNQKCTSLRRAEPRVREISRAAKKKWVAANPEKHRESNRRCFLRLTDGVVANQLGMNLSDVPKPVIEAKRALIQLKREIKNHEKHQRS